MTERIDIPDEGIVKYFDERTGFGRIRAADGATVHFYIANVAGGAVDRLMRVRFQRQRDNRSGHSRFEARHIRVVN